MWAICNMIRIKSVMTDGFDNAPKDHIVYTWYSPHTDVFPKSLFHSSTWFHLTRTQVLTSFEELSLSPAPVNPLAILRSCRKWWGGRRSCGSNWKRCGGLRDRSVQIPNQGQPVW